MRQARHRNTNQRGGGRVVVVGVDVDRYGIGEDRAGELAVRNRVGEYGLHVLVDRRREKLGLPVSAQRIHDVIDRGLEAHVQTPVHFVEDQAAHVRAVETRRLLEVLEETSGRGD